MRGADGNLRDGKSGLFFGEALSLQELADAELLYRLAAQVLCSYLPYIRMPEGGNPGNETAFMLLAQVLYRVLALGSTAGQVYELLGNELGV